MLATPCAISSMFGLCRPPVMPSATTADSSDSIAASTAMTMAELERSWMRWKLSCDQSVPNCGSTALTGMPPKRVPMVSIGSPRPQVRTAAATVPTSSATIGAGTRRVRRGHQTRIARHRALTPTVGPARRQSMAPMLS